LRQGLHGTLTVARATVTTNAILMIALIRPTEASRLL
jgi:hypothetical protein